MKRRLFLCLLVLGLLVLALARTLVDAVALATRPVRRTTDPKGA